MTNKLFYIVIVNALFILTQAWAGPQAEMFDAYLKHKEKIVKTVDSLNESEVESGVKKAESELKDMVDKVLGQEKFREKIEAKIIYI
jgi:hypothetical protein